MRFASCVVLSRKAKGSISYIVELFTVFVNLAKRFRVSCGCFFTYYYRLPIH